MLLRHLLALATRNGRSTTLRRHYLCRPHRDRRTGAGGDYAWTFELARMRGGGDGRMAEFTYTFRLNTPHSSR